MYYNNLHYDIIDILIYINKKYNGNKFGIVTAHRSKIKLGLAKRINRSDV